MTKTISIQSKKTYLHDTIEHEMFNTYLFTSVSNATSFIATAVAAFNTDFDPKHPIMIVSQFSDGERGKVKLRGKRSSVRMFVTALVAIDYIRKNFDIKF
jgi:hypothetical protein